MGHLPRTDVDLMSADSLGKRLEAYRPGCRDLDVAFLRAHAPADLAAALAVIRAAQEYKRYVANRGIGSHWWPLEKALDAFEALP